MKIYTLGHVLTMKVTAKPTLAPFAGRWPTRIAVRIYTLVPGRIERDMWVYVGKPNKLVTARLQQARVSANVESIEVYEFDRQHLIRNSSVAYPLAHEWPFQANRVSQALGELYYGLVMPHPYISWETLGSNLCVRHVVKGITIPTYVPTEPVLPAKMNFWLERARLWLAPKAVSPFKRMLYAERVI